MHSEVCCTEMDKMLHFNDVCIACYTKDKKSAQTNRGKLTRFAGKWIIMNSSKYYTPTIFTRIDGEQRQRRRKKGM